MADKTAAAWLTESEVYHARALHTVDNSVVVKFKNMERLGSILFNLRKQKSYLFI